MTHKKSTFYGIRLAIIYAIVWFIDLLDASSLNVTLPVIAKSFGINPTDAEWVIVGFLLAMAIGITISGWLGDNYGTKKVFLLSQLLYILSSVGCGMSRNLSFLIGFRLIQGFAGGLALPIGMAALVRTMPQMHWAKMSATMNLVTLFAPALGPLFGSYVTSAFGWRWIFFLKLPLSFICLFLSIYWIKKEKIERRSRFDWMGFILGGLSLSGILWVFSEVGKKVSNEILIAVFLLSGLLGGIFFWVEKKTSHPLMPLSIFRVSHFSYGNLIQSAANTIFLGANFIIALYLQKGLGLSLVDAGWIMAAVTPGLLIVQPLIGRFYNRLGPLPFIVPGLILLSLSTYAFIFTTAKTSSIVLALFVFFIGASSSVTQAANVASIFSDLPDKYRGVGSSLYSLFKQISASFGVAISTMVLSLGMVFVVAPDPLRVFHYCFLVLGSIPALALICCFYIDNQRAINQMKGPSHIPTETEYGAE